VAARRCTKRRYATKRDAAAAIAKMAERYGGVVYKKPYRCGKCRAWHITSTPPGGPKRVQH
jgi:hypothetical protein